MGPLTCFKFLVFLPSATVVGEKVMFSQACVKNSVHGGRGVSQHELGRQTPPPAGIPACIWADLPPPRRPLQQTVRILLECFLVGMCCQKPRLTPSPGGLAPFRIWNPGSARECYV